MIPKKIHYCWFGGKELPALAQKCVASWEKHCPQWEIVRWDESNFDFDRYPFAAYCLKNKKWAFLSDIVRLAVVHEYGGVYLDTDVEVLRPLDSLLENEAFFGWETRSCVATGLGFGAEAGHPTVKAMLEQYLAIPPDENGDYSLVACPALNTQPLVGLGLQLNGQQQTVAGAQIYPAEYFNPYEYTTGRMKKTKDTYSVHWYNQSWISPGRRLRAKLTKPFHRLFGTGCFQWLQKGKKKD